jgi:hypothetical protein
MFHWSTTALFSSAFCIVMMHWFPCRTWLNDIKWFGSVLHGLHHKMQLAVESVPFVVGVCPYIGARYRSKVLIAMALTHRCLLPEPVGSKWFP